MATWNDLLLRINLADNGTYPRTGTPCESPDIIPYGAQPIDNWQTVFAGNYGSDVGRSVLVNQDNYIYSRVKNLSGNPAEGELYAYWSPASALVWPRQWSGNAMKTNGGGGYALIGSTQPGAVGVCSEPLKWNPRPLEPNHHYCLVARISTEAHPNPIPDVTRLADFAQYIRDNPNVCWRNVTMIDADMPETSFDIGYSQGVDPGMMIVQISGTAMPVAGPGQTPASVAFNCSTPGPQPLMVLNPTPITQADQDIGLHTYVPANFEAPVTISFWNPSNLPISDNFNLDFQWFLSAATTVPAELFLHENGYTDPCQNFGVSAKLEQEVRDDMMLRNLLTENGPVRVVRVGGYTIRKSMLKK